MFTDTIVRYRLMYLLVVLPAVLMGGCFSGRSPSRSSQGVLTDPSFTESESVATASIVISQPTSTLAAPANKISTAQEEPNILVNPLSAAVNIRRGPGITYEIVGVLNKNATAKVLARDETGSWYNIIANNGLKGWVAANLVQVTSGQAAQIVVAGTEQAAPVIGDEESVLVRLTSTVVSVVDPTSPTSSGLGDASPTPLIIPKMTVTLSSPYPSATEFPEPYPQPTDVPIPTEYPIMATSTPIPYPYPYP